MAAVKFVNEFSSTFTKCNFMQFLATEQEFRGNNFLSLPPLEIRSPGPSLHLVFLVLGTRSPEAKSRDGDQIPRTRSPSGILGTGDQVSTSKLLWVETR